MKRVFAKVLPHLERLRTNLSLEENVEAESECHHQDEEHEKNLKKELKQGSRFVRCWLMSCACVASLTVLLDEKVNAHLPYYSTLKSSGMFSSKRFKLDCSSSVVDYINDFSCFRVLLFKE